MTIKLKLEKDEKSIVNGILLENCMMTMGSAAVHQKNSETRKQIEGFVRASAAAQRVFFDSCMEGEKEIELPEDLAEFIKSILEGSHKHLSEVKESLIKSGHPDGFTIASTVEILGNIINKIPNQSIIVKP
jgi:hypothetical protein